jgi:uncharacterized protein
VQVVLFLDHACNLRCSYCYNGPKFARTMPLDVARRGVDMALSGPPSRRALLTFFGGEPLMHLPLMGEIVAYGREEAARRRRRLRTVVVTNGTLLDREASEFIAANDIYLGVSIDGCREAHDAARVHADGSSSYDGIVENLRAHLARAGGPGLRVIAVVTPANVAFLGRSFDALLDLGVRNVVMNIDYEADWDDEARGRFEDALGALGDRYVAAHRRGVPFTLKLIDDKIDTHVRGGYTCADRCDFGCEEVTVAPSGRLYPCERLVGQDDREDLVIGHVTTGIDPVRRDALLAAKNEVLEGCADCALLGRCMHWCGCVNHAMTGSVGEVSGLLCWFEQRVIEQADRCAGILHAEDNDGFRRRFYLRGGPSDPPGAQ